MQKFSKKRTIRIFPHQTVKPIRPPSRMARNLNGKKCLIKFTISLPDFAYTRGI